MKKITLSVMFLLGCLCINAQSYIGAWERNHFDENGEALKSVVIFADGYKSTTTYQDKTGEFISTNGGSWQVSGNIMIEKVEFDTSNPDNVGSKISSKVAVTDSILSIMDTNQNYKRLDSGEPGKLKGAWLMSGRVVDGKNQQRATDGPRKTMKILSGTRFQWIAYNTDTKQFMGTGGGTYTTENGVYVENIVFFSRDNSRVGASLDFNYKLENGDWHHSGLSSKGDPINEIWSLRE